MFINAVVRNLSGHQLSYRGELIGIRITSALKGLVYLKVSRKSKEQRFLREIIT